MEWTAELLDEWFYRMTLVKDVYKEPLLDDKTVNLIKSICEILKFDIYVFVMSVEVTEEYIKIKNDKQEIIEDNILVLAAIILICNKSNGEMSEVKVTHMNRVLQKLLDRNYALKDVCKTEMEIMLTLDDRLPISTKVDEVNTLIEKYMSDGCLKANIRKLSTNILELMYLNRSKWFYELKKVYEDTEENREIFKLLISSKFYLPIGILYCALNLTKYKNFIKVKQLIKDTAIVTKIHVDHIQILTNSIFNLVLQCLPLNE